MGLGSLFTVQDFGLQYALQPNPTHNSQGLLLNCKSQRHHYDALEPLSLLSAPGAFGIAEVLMAIILYLSLGRS